VQRVCSSITYLTTCRLATYSRGVELRPPSYFTLAALIDGPLHGYAIMRRASELSDGTVRVSTGTLYSILERALSEGLIVAGDAYVVSGRERRDYSLTPAGRLVLEQESHRLARAATVVGTRLRATGAPAT
jgi:PadR family transcriptional regulator, regulatory protein PadR